MKSSIKLSKFFYLLLIISIASFSNTAFGVTESVRVSSDNDDAEQFFTLGTMTRDNNEIIIGYSALNARLQTVGMRFQNLDIPQGATINSAYIEFKAADIDASTADYIIYGENIDDAKQFTKKSGNISDRDKTLASENWNPNGWSPLNTPPKTVDISSIIQEIVGRSDWSANNDAVIIIEPGPNCLLNLCQRKAVAHDGDPSDAPLLVVDYTVAATKLSVSTEGVSQDYDVDSYGGNSQDRTGTVAIRDAGLSLYLDGNRWQKIDFPYTVTANTVIEFDFQSTVQGEIQGLGFDSDLSISENRSFRVYGTQNWGISDFDTYMGSGLSHFTIPVGQFYTGNFQYLFFMNDDDSSAAGNSLYSNINVYEAGAVSPEIANVSGSCSALSEVTILFTEDVEQTSAETASNYQVLKPSGASISINSAVRTSTDTVRLSLASFLNDLTDYTVVINNVQSLGGATINADSSDIFSLSCNLNCIDDNFAGPGALSASWSASSSSGTFGTPRIVENGRLRLTDASGQVATVATLLNQFPGADNKIEVEFDLYAYGGTGADGIVVTFSDASIPPVPGSYGGALGYAQRSGGGVGFAGGWLGVGIDEYGNFANPNEGKVGGSGFERDSVALRGSGSGTSGYPYLTSTGSLSPGVDQIGGTPNPGHRYKITVDHTMGGGQALVTVERDTGSGYVAVIPQFDIFAANPSQAVVPDNWVVSFTGSTGGATNIHEIGALQVCAAQPISAYGSPDHYEISHNSPGITCEGSQVTVTAHDASHNAFNVYSNTDIAVSTSPTVGNILTSPITIPAGSSSASFYLQQTSALSNIDIDVSDGTATDIDGDTSGEDPRFSFSDTAFRFYANGVANNISKQVAGVNTTGQNLILKAIKTDDETGACIPALQGPTPTNVDIAYECNSPTTCSSNGLLSFEGQALTGDDQGNGPNYVSVPMVFDGNGEAGFDFSFADAGQITLRAQKAVTANDPDPAFTLSASSNAFWVRPFGLELSAQSAGSDIDGNTSSSATIHKAADPFSLEVRAVNASGLVTPNYRPGQLQLQLTRTGPLVGSDGILNYAGSGSMTSALAGSATFQNVTMESFVGGALGNGASQYLVANYSEVGLIDLDIQDSNYGGPLDPIQGTAINVGRFYPDHFDLSLTSASFASACNNFTYLGQDFFFDTAPELTIEAKNSAGVRTQNYTGDYWKLGASLVEQGMCNGISSTKGFCYSDNVSAAAGFSGPNSSQNYGDLSAINGQKVMSLHDQSFDGFTYTRPLATSAAPFDGDIGLQIELEDSDGIAGSASLNNIGFSSDSNTAGTGFNTTNDQLLRHGRWKMENAYGPETQNLAIQAHVEYYSLQNKFEFNPDDSCTALNASDITLNGAISSNPVSVGAGSSNFSFNSPLILAENENFLLSLPGAGNSGDVDIDVDLTNYPWLQFDWNQDGSLIDHPTIKASFGQYRGHDRIIYWREVAN